jgi:DNA polymerase-3 subunit beta
MKFSILQDNLTSGINLVSRYTSNKGQLPILANILITAVKTGVILTATNLETGIRVNIGGKVEEEGSITVPAKNFSDFISGLPVQTVNLLEDKERLKISSGSFQATLATISASEFPAVAEALGESVTIEGQIIKQAASQVAFAAAVDDSRPVLTGVKFSKIGDKLTVVATDGFRLSRKELISALKIPFSTLIIPSHTLVDLAKVIENDGAKMYFISQNNQVVFDTGRVQIVSRILEGNFPDVDKIIPKEYKTQATTDRQGLLRAVRSASVFAREANNIVKLEIGDEKLVVKAVGGQTGESESTVEAEIEGDSLQISFNYKYIVDFLNVQVGERTVLKLNEATTPAVFAMEKDESQIYLIMPVRI